MVETAIDGCWLSDVHGRLLEVNAAYCRMSGHSAEELLTMRVADLEAEETADEVAAHIQKIMAQGEDRFEARHRRKDGSVFDVEVSVRYQPADGGHLVHFLRDFTEHKRREENLARLDQKYELILRSAAEGIVGLDLQGNHTFVNPAAERMLGYAAEELIGRQSHSTWHHTKPDGSPYPKTECAICPTYREGAVHHTSSELFWRKDGTGFPVEYSSTPIYEDGRLAGAVVTFTDITRRRQAEEEVGRMALALDTAPNSITVHDFNGRFLYANERTFQLNGYGRDELLALDLRQLDVPESARLIEARMQDLREHGEAFFEAAHFRKDGTIMPVEIRAKVTTWGGTEAILSVATDITDRKLAEEALRESEERSRIILQTAMDGFWLTDLDGRLLEVNEAYCRMSGYGAQELLAMCIADLEAAETGDETAAHFRTALTRGEDRFESRHRRKDGSTFYVEVSVQHRPERGGRFVAFLQDITERRLAGEEIRRMALMIEAAPSSIMVHDFEGRFLYANERTFQLNGYSRDEFLSLDLRQLAVPESAELIEARMQELRERGTTSFEVVHRRKDGTTLPLEIINKITSWRGKEAILSIATDLTDRKEGEEALRRRLAELEALHNVSIALRTARTGDEALPILLDETLAALETDTGIIWLYHPESDDLRAAVARGWFKSFAHTPMKAGKGLAGTVFATEQTRVSLDFGRDPLILQPTAGRFPEGWGGVCVPIQAGEATIGVLVICMPPGDTISAQQVELLESLAEMGGTSLHRMSLHEETERQLSRLRAIHRVDQAISAGTDLHMTLGLLLEHVAIQLQVDATDVLLLNQHTLTLEHAAGRGFRTGVSRSAHIRLGEGLAGRAALERRAVHARDLARMQRSSQFAALQAAEGFAAYYAVPLIAKGQVVGVLEVFHRTPLAAGSDWVDLLETLGGQAAIAIENAQLFEGMQRSNLDLALAYDATIEGWSHALDLRDRETEGHTQRVTEMTMRLARAMGVSDAELVHVRRGARLHDIGKMGVPDGILLKPGPLTEEEWVLMRMHPQLAYDLLAPITYLRPALDIPYCHHERMDGSGYPRGLAGEQIPLAARLFAVIDVWDALRSDRPYRPAWTEEAALAHIHAGAGTHFDPRVVEVFLRGLEED